MTAAVRAPRIVEFESAGTVLRGWLYEHEPAGGSARPAVVMTHGFSATATGMVADRFAEVFHAAGLNVLLFDGPSLGMSDGEPRRVLNRWTQLRAFRDALTFTAALPSVDAGRLAVWGDSMSGASAIGVAAFDHRVKVMVVQVPASGQTMPIDDPDGAAFDALRRVYLADTLPPVLEREGPKPVVSPNQESMPSLLKPITAFRWFIDYGGRYGTGWDNSATLETSDTLVAYESAFCAPRLRAASMWVIANDDEMPGAATPVALHAFELAPEPKELMLVDGGHFGVLYYPSELFDQTSTAQAEFLIRHLG